MIPIEKAREIILEHVQPLPAERVWLADALGRYLAEDVTAEKDIPLFDNSAMDGYAVRTQDITAPGVCLVVTDIAPAGSEKERDLSQGSAVRIMTGAPIPRGADAVVRREDTREEEGRVWIDVVPKACENIRFRGEDIRRGSQILPRGTLLGPAEIGVLASVEKIFVNVAQRPLVAVIATGDEIVEPGGETGVHSVVSSNSFTITALVKESGAVPVYLGIARDRPEAIEEALSRASRCDLILTSGGVSMGDYDLVRPVLARQGNSLIFWGVEMKPGKPLAFGTIAGIPAVGLPGNPVSTMTAFYQFVRPALLKMQGARRVLPEKVRARLLAPVKNRGDRPHYMRARLERSGDDLVVTPTGPQGSGILSSMVRGNCFCIVPKGVTSLDAGEWVECEVYAGAITAVSAP